MSRRTQNNAVGVQGYSAITADREEIIATGIRAHIQLDRQSPGPQAKLPGDPLTMPVWKIIFKAALGGVLVNDTVTDDLGNRYQVAAADWNPLVTTCRAQILEV